MIHSPLFRRMESGLAFRSERDGGGIFVMGTLGESAKRLSDFGYNPSWSPDGKQIVCTTREGVEIGASGDRSSQLWSVSVETAETRLIHTGGVYNPSWSPNGRRIAYCSWYPNSIAENMDHLVSRRGTCLSNRRLQRELVSQLVTGWRCISILPATVAEA